MKRESNPLMTRFSADPCLIDANRVDQVIASLGAVMGDPKLVEAMGSERAEEAFWPEPGHWMNAYRPYQIKDGVLHIPVKGVLLHDFPFQFGSWATGYQYIERAFARGCEDFAAGNIKGIAMVIHSPGGQVAGCFDALDKMVALRDAVGVPVRSFAHEGAYSAAFAIALVENKGIAVSRTGGVGSIGVVTTHYDWSKANDNFGVKVTYIFAGKHKVDGNPDAPLPDDVKANIQARIDELYQVFVSAVARNRGLEEAAVRATEAQCFTATQAVSNGLADTIGSLDDAVAAYVADLSSDEGDDEMSTKDNLAVDQAAHTEAVTTARAEGFAAGKTEGQTTERTRIAAILATDEAKDRPVAAMATALKTPMTVEAAKDFLASLSVERPEGWGDADSEDAETPFDKAMGNGPEVGGAGAKSDADPKKQSTLASRVIIGGKRHTDK